MSLVTYIGHCNTDYDQVTSISGEFFAQTDRPNVSNLDLVKAVKPN